MSRQAFGEVLAHLFGLTQPPMEEPQDDWMPQDYYEAVQVGWPMEGPIDEVEER